MLNGLLIASAVALVTIPAFGALSDRLGRRPVYLFGAVVTALFAYPLFWLFDTGSTPLVWLALIVAFTLSHGAMYAPQAAFLSELFGSRVRYSGASLGAQLASVLAGGLSHLDEPVLRVRAPAALGVRGDTAQPRWSQPE